MKSCISLLCWTVLMGLTEKVDGEQPLNFASMAIDAVDDASQEIPDPRNHQSPNAYISRISHGGAYCCSPYIFAARDGTLVCVVTVGHDKREGHGGQHMVSLRSTDGGKSWTDRIDIEPPRQPGDERDRVSTYGTALQVPSTGRIYAIYWYDDYTGSRYMRKDMVGNLYFRYSDDHARTWSTKRYLIPYRVTQIEIVDSRQSELVLDPGIERLSLLTCYPLDAPEAGGPLRLVVTAEAIL